MTNSQQKTYVDIHMDPDNLYHEEVFTDGKVGAIRRLKAVKVDGIEDESRETLFMGNTQLISPTGQPVPIQFTIEASSIKEAIEKFPDAVNAMVERIMTEAKEQQEKEASTIITPGK